MTRSMCTTCAVRDSLLREVAGTSPVKADQNFEYLSEIISKFCDNMLEEDRCGERGIIV